MGTVNRFHFLSKSFGRRASEVEFLSYRNVDLRIDYSTSPDSNVIDKSFALKGFDKINTGLETLVQIRTVLEKPEKALQILPYLKFMDNEKDDILGSDNSLKQAFSKDDLIKLQENHVSPKKIREEQIEKTNQDLEKMFSFLLKFPETLSFDFSDSNRRINADDIESQSATKHFVDTKKILVDWSRNIEKKCRMHGMTVHLKQMRSFYDIDKVQKYANPEQKTHSVMYSRQIFN